MTGRPVQALIESSSTVYAIDKKTQWDWNLKKKNFAYANNILITQPFLAEDSTTHQNKFITEFIISDEVASWQGIVVTIKCYYEKAKTINFGQSNCYCSQD